MNGFLLCDPYGASFVSSELAPVFLVAGLIYTLFIASLWRLFEKAGETGWHALIPVYNVYIATQIAGQSGWYTLGFFIPGVSMIVRIVLGIEIAHRFDRSTAFGVGLGLLSEIFLPILAFSDSKFMLAVPEDGYRTFINEEGDLVEEVPLDEWRSDQDDK